jgi:hypothetical protein
MGYSKASGKFAQKRTLPGLPPKKEKGKRGGRAVERTQEDDVAIVYCLGFLIVVAVILVVIKASV